MSKLEPKALYLCLLDNLNLDGELSFGSYKIRSYKANELAELLRSTNDGKPTDKDSRVLEELSWFPWASCEMPIKNNDELRTKFPGWAKLSDIFWARINFVSQVSIKPFGELLRSLNLYKENAGPVFLRHLYLLLLDDMKSERELVKKIKSPYAIKPYEPDGDEGPYLFEYKIGRDDEMGLQTFHEQLERCLTKDVPSGMPSNTHLRVATHYFMRGDELMVPYPSGFDILDPLMAYDAAIEALLILEEEKSGTSKKLENRICSVISNEPRHVKKVINWRYNPKDRLYDISEDDVKHFMRRIFWLRSKIAHGVRTIEEIEKLINIKPDEHIVNMPPKNADHIPVVYIKEAPYSQFFLPSGMSDPFPGFLVNTRELARRTIRYFLDEYDQGQERKNTLSKLDQRAT